MTHVHYKLPEYIVSMGFGRLVNYSTDLTLLGGAFLDLMSSYIHGMVSNSIFDFFKVICEGCNIEQQFYHANYQQNTIFTQHNFMHTAPFPLYQYTSFGFRIMM